MTFNTIDLDKGFQSLNLDGFKFKKEVMGYSWTKIKTEKKQRIIIGFRGYPDSFKVYTPVVDIYFNEIEEILNPLLEKYQIQNRFGETTIHKSLIDIRGVDYSKLQIEINNEETFGVVKKEVETIILNGALPFFEQYNELQNVNETIDNYTEDNLSEFISGIVGIKIPLVKKLTHANSFIKELKSRNEFYTKEVFRYPQYFKDHEKVFDELFAKDLKQLKN